MQRPNTNLCVLRFLRDDERGATLTTELLMLSTLTVAGILTIADDVRSGMHARVSHFVDSISATATEPHSSRHAIATQSTSHCIAVVDLDDSRIVEHVTAAGSREQRFAD